MKHIDPSKIIDALGGTTPVARACEVRPQAVSKWRSSHIPAARLAFLRLRFPAEMQAIEAENAKNGVSKLSPPAH